MMSFRISAPTITKNDLGAQLAQIGLLGLAEGLEDFPARATRLASRPGSSSKELVRLEQTDDLRAEVSQTTFRRKVQEYASPHLLVIDAVDSMAAPHIHWPYESTPNNVFVYRCHAPHVGSVPCPCARADEDSYEDRRQRSGFQGD